MLYKILSTWIVISMAFRYFLFGQPVWATGTVCSPTAWTGSTIRGYTPPGRDPGLEHVSLIDPAKPVITHHQLA